ncbi:DNA repair protein RecO [Alteromonas sediminis]|uniref:DNA repair protein RecO n=1 Tax=Alteromonas sediminis TaxID=2259342 RepID=A0A3N5YL20_9ALTE|nr:DNA repair protein RecO [Alteromonas sediminis]RPJ65751.1 DNA repair protein RecO [Alteromonas sediminis]
MAMDTELMGYVIHHRPYRETSVIADFFTRSEGRVSAVVRGVRKAKSDKKSLIQGFQPLCLMLMGKSELKTLKHIEAKENAFKLQGEALYCGFYMNELLTRAIPNGLAVELVFDMYEQCLQSLTSLKDYDIVLRQFEFSLLEELGVMPDFTVEAHSGAPIDPNSDYAFTPEVGFTLAQYSEFKICGAHILGLQQEAWSNDSRKLAKWLCRQMLLPVVGQKPLNSRALFRRS